MTVLSFVGKSFAKKGFRFYFQEINPDCPKNCQLYTTCQKNLQKNTVYDIVEVMNRVLPCPKDLHQEDMNLVKLDEPKIQVSMANKDIFVGSIVKFNPVGCEREDCQYIDFCEPNKLLIHGDQKLKIKEVVKKVKDCPKNLPISIINIEIREK